MYPESDRLLDLLGSSLNRHVLALTSEEARSAEEIAERCDSSLPTVYRHIDDLRNEDLLRERDRYDEEGNHYKVYRAGLEEATIRVADGEVRVAVEHPDEQTEDEGERPVPEGADLPGEPGE